LLANRPGFPFLGNNFFTEIGDLFSQHVIDSPDINSEILLLKKYAPNVSDNLIRRLSFLSLFLYTLFF
jgi:von Willebrand factor A domain-containing protein 8